MMYRRACRSCQRKVFKCQHDCCDDKRSSREVTPYLSVTMAADKSTSGQVELCLNQCTTGVQEYQQRVQDELGRFQARIQRCYQECDDRARDMALDSKGVSANP